MSLVIAAAGDAAILDAVLKTAATPEALILKLYSNNHTPAKGDTSVSYTGVSGGGYAAITLTRAGWNASVNGGSNSTSTYSAGQSWTFTGTVTVFGYYLVGATSGTLYWAELVYPTTGQVFNSGDSLTITPTFTLN
jgi:hypothetical protein